MIESRPDKAFELPRPWVFLAGTIENGSARNWQEEIVSGLKDVAGTILNPRRENWNALATNSELCDQIEWELDGISKSDIVAFNFLPDSKSPVSMLELGLAVGLKKDIVLCCPTSFWRHSNVIMTCSLLSGNYHCVYREDLLVEAITSSVRSYVLSRN